MANTDVARYAPQVTNNEVGRCWTHVKEITYADFQGVTSASDGDTVTFQLFRIPTNSIVESVGYRLVTAFNDDVGGTNLTVALGDTGDPNGFVVENEVHADGTELFIGANDGAYLNDGTTANTVNGKEYNTTANVIEAIFTPTGMKCEELNAGKIVFWARILDTNLLV